MTVSISTTPFPSGTETSDSLSFLFAKLVRNLTQPCVFTLVEDKADRNEGLNTLLVLSKLSECAHNLFAVGEVDNFVV